MDIIGTFVLIKSRSKDLEESKILRVTTILEKLQLSQSFFLYIKSSRKISFPL